MQALRKIRQVSWPTIFANGFSQKPSGARRPLDTAQDLCVVKLSKHASLALKPFGAGLLGCDCSGQSSNCLNIRTASTNNLNSTSRPGPANVSTTLTFEQHTLTIWTELTENSNRARSLYFFLSWSAWSTMLLYSIVSHMFRSQMI